MEEIGDRQFLVFCSRMVAVVLAGLIVIFNRARFVRIFELGVNNWLIASWTVAFIFYYGLLITQTLHNENIKII